ncbi:hypothetical protein G6011_08249 [Alternaria panax]|uniref:Amino acid permease/ SLC12A domain-containing protein n=1 Tax=Alternaria panax TaxID=48097 RepID=A0AAD4FIC6_9PLEO|nr:hypothetical protein G6011_08249 [Alternaria panax]
MAICVAECISEMVQLFPAPNAIAEYTRHLIDEDFGWAIGIAYWLTYLSIFAAQNIMAASLSEYWGEKDGIWRPIVFYFAANFGTLGINMVGARLFGWVEAIGGILKIALVILITVVLAIVLADVNNEFQVGFRRNTPYAASDTAAICYVIPIVTFGFIGIEAAEVISFEAAPGSLQRPSKNIAYIASFLYLACMSTQVFSVPWTSRKLPDIYSGIGELNKRNEGGNESVTHILVVIAVRKWNKSSLDGLFDGAMIFSVIFASNTALYIASRTLYGMVIRMHNDSYLVGKLRHLSKVNRKTGCQSLLS